RPRHGPPTARVTVSGTGFGPIEQVVVTFDAVQLGTTTTDDTGSFATRIRVPRTALPGEHTITATGQSSGPTASKKFLVRTDWPRFRFDDANTGFNIYENVLDPSSVTKLGLLWGYKTGRYVTTSPAVARGIVYAGSDDHKLYALDAS